MNPSVKESQRVFNGDQIIHRIYRSWWILVSTQSFDVPPNETQQISNNAWNHRKCLITKSNKAMELFWTNRISNCMHKIVRIQLFIIDKALSSTLVEGLASHNNNRQETINWNHWESKLTIKKCLQRPRHNKSHVFALYGASQHPVTREKKAISNKN